MVSEMILVSALSVTENMLTEVHPPNALEIYYPKVHQSNDVGIYFGVPMQAMGIYCGWAHLIH